ncbi:hypothetical protein QQ045_031980 [Rhodiola kirilowii]
MENVRCPERSIGRARGERLSGRSPSRLDYAGMGLKSLGSFRATCCASHHFNSSPFPTYSGKTLRGAGLGLLREEVLWLQRSRISWLKFGDRNTKFFHACANQRRKKNWIKELRDDRGNRFSERNKLTSMATDYFDEIFRPSYTDGVVDWSQQLVCLQPVISEVMNRGLLEDISEEEVRRAVFNMSPLKAPGVDGIPALFYQKNWGNVRGYVVAYVREFWMNGVLDDRFNKTLIVLIPKKKDADRMEDLRPISLCNVAIKIITKILAARLQGILDKVISASQSAFIKGRIITDKFIVAHEISHFLKRCRSQKEFFASIKVDMSKAYDQVE